MKLAAALSVIAVSGALAACQSDTQQYDGVSRFAGSSITAPDPAPATGISPEESPAPPLPDIPGPGPEGPDLSVTPYGA